MLGLILDENGPNPVSKMPGNFSTQGESDLERGLLQLKSPGSNMGRWAQ